VEFVIDDYALSVLYQSVQQFNILPLTSACPQSCIFCSHKFNPREIESFQLGHLSLALLEDLFPYLDTDNPVVIGESATRINEGEPFSHPRWQEILLKLRQKYPETPLKITSSGEGLKIKDIKLLQDFKPLRLCLSLNLISPDYRQKYLGVKKPARIKTVITELANTEIELEGSMVVLPRLTGFSEISKTIKFLAQTNKFKVVRLFKPGYTRFATQNLQQVLSVADKKLKEKIADLQREVELPLIYESAEIVDLLPVIQGIIRDTPAHEAGLKAGDILEEIEGDKPFSRVAAFHRFNNLLEKKESFKVLIKRGAKSLTKEVRSKEGFQSTTDYGGLVMAYDFSRPDYENLKEEIIKTDRKNIIILTAPAAVQRLQAALLRLEKELDKNWQLKISEPEFFGGNISATGLLTVSDIFKTLKQEPKIKKSRVIMSSLPFDNQGRDLKGDYYTAIEERLSCEISLL